jgi:oligoendopeptidase F
MMKQAVVKLTAIFLIICILTGCTPAQKTPVQPQRTFASLKYTRPDMNDLEFYVQRVVQAVQGGNTRNEVVDYINNFYEAYDSFYTNFYLASIYHDIDMQDEYWQEEYGFCSSAAAQVDVLLDDMYRALAQSPMRVSLESPALFGEGFFDSYLEESPYDEGYMILAEEELRLENLYYELCAEYAGDGLEASAYYTIHGPQLAQVFADLIAVRQDMADYLGYDSYPQLAYDMYHYREYTPRQTEKYMEQLGQELKSLYTDALEDNRWNWSEVSSNEEKTFAYVKKAAEAMGGVMEEAFKRMETGNFYHILSDGNKYDGGYEVYLTAYRVPFVYLKTNDVNYDKLAFAHEFGHFVHDYVCQGTYASTDVTEVMSQATEYMSTVYAQDRAAESYKLIDGLWVLVEQACYTAFEIRAYSLKEGELTPDGLAQLFKATCEEFGLAWESPMGFTSIQHFYGYPMYISSYVYSADVAFQIYQKEKETAGAGLQTLEQCMASNEMYLMQFVQENGLESPFKIGRAKAIRASIEAVLGQ